MMKNGIRKTTLLLLAYFLIGTAQASPTSHETAGAGITQQSDACSGLVKDATGEPVIGASVYVKGTTNGTITGLDGTFALADAKAGDILVVSFIGYKTQEVAFEGRPLTVVLEDDAQQLGEVVVTALGIKKDAKKLGYAVSTIGAGDLNKTAAPSLGAALYGKASGVRIQTAPGGAMGSISINVRGLSSITGTNQPLVVVDGVPVHNGDTNNSGYWENQRIQQNGLADINPEDIESLSILKGASASALYGSEAANGVVMITTKSGKGGNGFGVEINAGITADMVAYMPEYQTKYGPGARVESRVSGGDDPDGFRTLQGRDGKTYTALRPTYSYWGPKYDGRDVLYFDGTVRKYRPITADPWSDVFRTGFSQQYNVAITKGNEKGNIRFSYTYVDNLPTQYNSTFKKHNFNLTGSQNVTDNIKLGYGATFLIQDIKNRPYRISRLTDNFGGFFGPFDDISYLRRHTVTSLGYQNQKYNSPSHLTPDEGFEYGPPCSALVDEYYWHILGKEYLENNSRLMANLTPSWEIAKGLTLKGRIATDLSVGKIESKESVQQSIVFGEYGYYSLHNNRYDIVYGDAMLNYTKQLTEKLGLDATIGWQGRQERQTNVSAGTNGGLSVENWFHLNASKKTPSANTEIKDFLKTATFGMLSLSYGDWAYIEGTARREKISTLAPGGNAFFYPSVNGSFIYTSLLRDKLPEWYDYGKVRVSYGVVGNAPEIYKGSKAYTQKTVGGRWIYNGVEGEVGNEGLRPEKKFEWELGLESKFFNNRLGFELSYYTNTVKDQILNTTMPSSAGGTSIWLNVGELKNKGFELSLYGTPIATRDWTWTLRGNLAWNKNVVSKLADGIDQLEHSKWDGGAAYLYSKIGRPMGDIYAYVPDKNENGEYLVMDNGFYKLTGEPVKVGNAMPKLVGGVATTLSYKDFTLDMSFDYRIGGAVLNTGWMYMMGQGALKETLKYHDGEGYGSTYYLNNDVVTPYEGTTGPNGERIYDNGIILPGVRVTDGKPNTTMIAADKWANWNYNWGSGPNDAITHYDLGVFDNTYLKCRELSIGYNLPASILSKIQCKSLQLSVFGRNLFYVYKNLPGFDAEATDGTSWITQAKMGGSTATTRSIGLSLRATF
ncbi:MAG: SusC/RagA family TonB-linked outer membrane protein [Mediterranea sp.]|jgi:TonB-linked SusC/RagA family outer membrane protein|nr:SusC/RagA family TonB-linked outer membrane protein [Mediterranea sp.]